MSNTKHTPGPWSVDPNAPEYITADATGYQVATCTQGDYNEPMSTANAKLIAAAPDGYAANVAAFETRRRNEDGTWTISPRAMNMIERAIAKATSQQ